MNHYPFMNSSTWLCASALFLATTGLLPAQEGPEVKPDAKPQTKKEAEPRQKYTPGRTQSRSYFFKEADKKMDYSIYTEKF